jgi:hypothetical protein
MKLFNSIQIVSLLVASPTLLSLGRNATFPGATGVFYLGCLVSAVLFIWTTAMVYTSIEK